MFSWIVLIIVLALLSLLGIWAWSVLFGRGVVMDAVESPRAVLKANREFVAGDDLDAIAFDVVSHGYRQDQVDDVLAVLKARITELKSAALVDAEPERTDH